jgi:hypothetical protein
MLELLDALCDGARYKPGTPAMSDDNGVLTGGGLVARVVGLAGVLRARPQRIGLLGAHSTDWAIAQLAAWACVLQPPPARTCAEGRRHRSRRGNA